MSLLSDRNPLSKTPRKRSFEDDNIPPNFKCPNVIRQFLTEYGSRVSGVTATESLKIGEERAALENGGSVNVSRNGAQPKQIVKKYPSPKISKGIPILRQFPPLLGSSSNVSSSKCMVHGPLIESVSTNGTPIRRVIQESKTSERMIAGTASGEFVHKILTEPSVGNEIFNQVQGGTSSENEPPTIPPLDGNEKIDYIFLGKNGGLVNVTRNDVQPKQIATLGSSKTLSKTRPLTKKYPPPKIRKMIFVRRQFPPLFESINNVSSTKSMVHGPLEESMRTNGNQNRVEIREVYAAERSIGTTLEEFVEKIIVEPRMENGTCNQVHGGTSVEIELNKKFGNQNRVDIQEFYAAERSVGTALEEFVEKIIVEPRMENGSCNQVHGGTSVEIELNKKFGKQNRLEIQEFYAAERSVGTALEEFVEKIIVEPRMESGTYNQVHGGTSVENELNKKFGNQNRVEIQEVYAAERSVGTALEEFVEKIVVEPTTENETGNQVHSGTPIENELNKKFDNSVAATVQSIVPFDSYRCKVREALDLFEAIFKNLSREHQSKSKGQGKASSQIHIEAATVLKKQAKWVHESEEFLGSVPGVVVGDQFHFRAELTIVGLHRQLVAGIDFMKKDGKIFATCIVASGRYANDLEASDVLIYSGEGGNPKIGVRNKKLEDQKLERGNLALKNSMDARTPVRVIRGYRTSKASNIMGWNGNKTKNVYIYDGLYMVSKFWQERGQYGKLVFMFQLNRKPGQPKLPRKFSNKSKKYEVCKDLCVLDDISQGKEKIPIRTMNVINEKPPLFNYITSMIYPEWYNLPIPSGCDCTEGCSNSKKCSCALKNEGEIPFNKNGSIVRAKPIVYECGPYCKCPPSCMNRVSQHGIRYKFEVFKTESRGWGVRSRDYISSGSFICEYAGELLRDKEAERRIDDDEYLFDIVCDTNECILQVEPMDRSSFLEDKDDDGFTIDVARRGNIGRFINHSCSPNLFAQNVLYDHNDKKISHIMLFASKYIPPSQELTYDYNYKVDQVHDGKGNTKKKSCFCGSRECTGRMY